MNKNQNAFQLETKQNEVEQFNEILRRNKMDGLKIHSTTCMHFKYLTLSEGRKIQKTPHCVWFHLDNILQKAKLYAWKTQLWFLMIKSGREGLTTKGQHEGVFSEYSIS